MHIQLAQVDEVVEEIIYKANKKMLLCQNSKLMFACKIEQEMTSNWTVG